MLDDTIAAIATPSGNGAVGIVRLSGPEALSLLERIWEGISRPADFEPRRVYLGKIRGIDRVLAFWMKGPSSYTGEDVVEIQGHGGRRVLEMVLEACLLAGCRHAEPGEFTKRAFLNGRIDLAQAEAVADLIQAGSQRAVVLAERQMEGNLSTYVGQLRNEMKVMRAQMEAMIDFPEDEDVQGLHYEEISERLGRIRIRIQRLINTYKEGHLLKEGVRVAILGKPNVGKSSLFNALLEEDRAIVHQTPGTTRDAIEEVLDLGGVAVRFIDTAGIRLGEDATGSPPEAIPGLWTPSGTVDAIEAEGIRKAQEKLESADLILAVFDLSRPLDENDRRVLNIIGDRNALHLYNKSDLPPAFDPPHGAFVFSAKEKIGLEAIKSSVAESLISKEPANADAGPVLTNLRHRTALQRGLEALDRVRESSFQKKSLEYLVADLSSAMNHLGEVTGEIGNDEILSEIFSKFCIGK